MSSSIYTRQGDTGQTRLADNQPVDKDNLRLEAYGTLDEASAHLGLARAAVADLPMLAQMLSFVAHRLYNCSSALAFREPDERTPRIIADDVAQLERFIDLMEKESGPIGGFVLCGGTELAARLHVTRTVVRRGERAMCRLARSEPLPSKTLLKFVNRLSDFFFAAARYANCKLGAPDVMWDPTYVFPKS